MRVDERCGAVSGAGVEGKEVTTGFGAEVDLGVEDDHVVRVRLPEGVARPPHGQVELSARREHGVANRFGFEFATILPP